MMKLHFVQAILFSILCTLTQPGEAYWREGRSIQREKRILPINIAFSDDHFTRQSRKPQEDPFKFIRGKWIRVTSCVLIPVNRYSSSNKMIESEKTLYLGT